MDLAACSWRPSSSVQGLLVLQARLPSAWVQFEVLVAFEMLCRDFEKQSRKRGFVHASDDAAMPMPGSTVDQIETKALWYKNSLVLFNS